MLDKIDKLDKPTEPNTDMKLDLTMSRESGNDVLRAENLEKAFNNHTLFSGLSFEIKRGEHVAIMEGRKAIARSVSFRSRKM